MSLVGTQEGGRHASLAKAVVKNVKYLVIFLLKPG